MSTIMNQGGPVIYLLLVCSIIAITIIVERLFFWWRERRNANVEQLETFFDHVHRGEIDKARKIANDNENPLLDSMLSALNHSEDPRMHAMHEALELEIERALDRTRAYLGGLDTIATLTPLLGIFGTVLGIIQSFQVLGQSGVPDPQAVGAGLAEALITTAAGLAVAMPSLIFHNFFLSLSEKHVSRIDKFHREFEIHSQELEETEEVNQ